MRVTWTGLGTKTQDQMPDGVERTSDQVGRESTLRKGAVIVSRD